MRVVVTGATGLLGRYLLDGQPSEVEIHAISRQTVATGYGIRGQMHNLDLTSPQDIVQLLDHIRPSVVIHAAAEGGVDAVQGRMDTFRPLNVDTAALLSGYCAQRNIKFVFVSSNAVYGNVRGPICETSAQEPVNDYGLLKREAEEAVRSENERALIVRPILMYGWPYPDQRLNPVAGWVSSLRAGVPVRVVDDVWTEPLAAVDCSRAIWEGIARDIAGSVNVSGGERLTLFEFARMTAGEFALPESLIHAVNSSVFVGLARRPAGTAFELTRLVNEFGFTPMKPSEGLRWMRLGERLRDEVAPG